MPIIARFYGLIIKMYFQQSEHNPPHFHVSYGEHEGIVEINTLELIDGHLPRKSLEMTKEWAEKNKKNLLNIWNTQEFRQLPPLE